MNLKIEEECNIDVEAVFEDLAIDPNNFIKKNESKSTLTDRAYETNRAIQTLLIDNYDSYTYNLHQYIEEVNHQEPITITNDELGLSWKELKKTEKLFDRKSGKLKFDNIVISPGPGHPAIKDDIGICLDILKEEPTMPILGVCLGHQALGYVNGREITRVNKPIHGEISALNNKHHREDIKLSNSTGEVPPSLRNNEGNRNTYNLFANLPSSFNVVRYHSLKVESSKNLNADDDVLEDIAWTISPNEGQGDDRSIIMGIRHKYYPHFGVQFHPESIESEHGKGLLDNFRKITEDYHNQQGIALTCENSSVRNDDIQSTEEKAITIYHQDIDEFTKTPSIKSLFIRKLEVSKLMTEESCSSQEHLNSENLFDSLFGNCSTSFWLDSSAWDIENSIHQKNTYNPRILDETLKGNFSIMGSGPFTKIYEHYCRKESKTVVDNKLHSDTGMEEGFTVITEFNNNHLGDNAKTVHVREGNFFGLLRERMDNITIGNEYLVSDHSILEANTDMKDSINKLPFHGGLVGFLGYEMYQEVPWLKKMPQIPSCFETPKKNNSAIHSSEQKLPTPDAFFIDINQALIIDHIHKNDIYLIAVDDSTAVSQIRPEQYENSSAVKWISDMEFKILKATKSQAHSSSSLKSKEKQLQNITYQKPYPSLNDREYKNAVATCLDYINAGESYEVCLTNQIALPKISKKSPFEMYKSLRKNNPAPFSAFIQHTRSKPIISHNSDNKVLLKEVLAKHGSFSVLCSSPERFLSISQNKILESKPVKGTIKRGSSLSEDMALANILQNDKKSRAENLMIVDLVRNDLGRIAAPKSVSVPSLMHIESFATLHQMVSTIQAKLKEDIHEIDALISAFPGGSMTGAPKLRTMQIIQSIEKVPRGLYSGCIGYISNKRNMDFNIVIRTAIVSGENKENERDISIGAGGAIVALSDPEQEYEEMILKSKAVTSSLFNDSSPKDKKSKKIEKIC